MGRRRRPGFGSVPRFQQFGEGMGGALPTSDFDQSSDDIARHMAQERRGLNRKNQQIPSLIQRGSINGSHRMRRVATRSTEGGEIMLPLQATDRLTHPPYIQRVMQVPGVVQIKR